MSITTSFHKDTRPVGRVLSVPRAPLEPGTVLQLRYRVVKQLAKGGMGAVYEAIDQRLDATVAVKETFAVDDLLRRQFEQEARLLAQLSHPALPRVSDYFSQDDRAFLVMQFIAGVDLAEIIATQPGPFPRNQVVAWADQLLDALIFLHSRERQIIHRDIKPHNLKLTSSGAIALLDFGLAKSESPNRSADGRSISGYTRRYAPLEQIQDEGTTPRSDIYALGATLYHLLTGVKPVDAIIRHAARVGDMPDPLRPANELHPAVGTELAKILSRAMAENAADRFTSASEFREALSRLGRKYETGEPDCVMPLSPPPVSAPKERTRGADGFQSYSILKPLEPQLFKMPSTTRSNVIVLGILFVLLSGLVAVFYGYHRLNEPAASPQPKTNRSQLNSTDNNLSNKVRLN